MDNGKEDIPDKKKLVEEVDNSELASIKGIITGLFRVLNNPDSSAEDLEEVVELDPPLSAEILKLANSAYYASKVEFSDLKEAIIWVGFKEVRNLALTHQLYAVFNQDSPGNFARSDLWKNCISVAMMSQLIYRRIFQRKGSDIYTFALLRNLGIIIEDQILPEAFSQILSLRQNEDSTFIEAENEILGYNHQNIFAELAEAWELPDIINDTILYHHLPNKAPDNVAREVKTVYLADNFCTAKIFGYSDVDKSEEKYKQQLEYFDISEHSLQILEEELWNKIQPLIDQGLLSHG